ncbi:MAG: hypothetical protein P1U34_02770 [Coxiellaceae bacterium]|nr:hypothetical protein [Coxiellaceae bacterium]
MAIPCLVQIVFRRVNLTGDGFASDDGSDRMPLRLFRPAKTTSLSMTVELFFNMPIDDYFPFDADGDVDLEHTYAQRNKHCNDRLLLRTYSDTRRLSISEVMSPLAELGASPTPIIFGREARDFVESAMQKFFHGSAVHRPYDWLQANINEKRVYTIDDWHADMPYTPAGREKLFTQKAHDCERLKQMGGGDKPAASVIDLTGDGGMDLTGADSDADTVPYSR